MTPATTATTYRANPPTVSRCFAAVMVGQPFVSRTTTSTHSSCVRGRQYSDLAARKPDYFVVSDAAKSPRAEYVNVPVTTVVN